MGDAAPPVIEVSQTIFEGLRIRYDERVLTPRAWTALQSRWAASLLPYDEEALRRLLGTLDRVGDRAGVIEAYEAFAARLGQEFSEHPAQETTALVARVRARRLDVQVEHAAALTDAPMVSPAPATPVTAPSSRKGPGSVAGATMRCCSRWRSAGAPPIR